MKPPISYYGGKQKMVPHILPLIPMHTTYVEPFAGGAAVLFAKEPSPVEVINDLNGALVAFYRVMANPETAETLANMLEATPYAHSEFKRAGAILKDETASDLDKAWAFYYRRNNSFANVGMAWAFDVARDNCAVIYQNRLARLKQQQERLKPVAIECIDAIDLIEKWDSPTTFFYCDPPYPDTDQSGYTHGYSLDDFKALVAVLESIKGSFVLSCYPQDCLPNHWRKIEVNVSSGIAAGKNKTDSRRTECLWIGGNYQPQQTSLFH